MFVLLIYFYFKEANLTSDIHNYYNIHVFFKT